MDELSMTMSSRGSGRSRYVDGELASVAQQCPEHVDESSYQARSACVWMGRSLPFTVVEPPGWPVDAETGQGGHVAHSAQASVVASGAT